MPPLTYNRDVFICHASEDKPVAEMLYNFLNQSGKKAWYDKKEILAGDNIVEKIKEGLKNSMIMVIILSNDFFKEFPLLEIGGNIFNPYTKDNKIIPLRYKIELITVIQKLSFLATFRNLSISIDYTDSDFINKFKEIEDEILEKINTTQEKLVEKKKKSIERKKEIALKKEIKSQKKRNWVIFSIIVFIVITILIFFRSTLNNTFFNSIQIRNKDSVNIFKESQFNIVILSFYNPEKDKNSPAGGVLNYRYKIMDEVKRLGLGLYYDEVNKSNLTPNEAKAIARKIKYTDLVIWGIDSEFEKSSHIITFKWATLKENPLGIQVSNKIPIEGYTDKLEIPRLLEITDGTIHLNIDDIISWFLGIKLFHFDKNYAKALNIFKSIKNENYKNGDLYMLIAACYSLMKSQTISFLRHGYIRAQKH